VGIINCKEGLKIIETSCRRHDTPLDGFIINVATVKEPLFRHTRKKTVTKYKCTIRRYNNNNILNYIAYVGDSHGVLLLYYRPLCRYVSPREPTGSNNYFVDLSDKSDTYRIMVSNDIRREILFKVINKAPMVYESGI